MCEHFRSGVSLPSITGESCISVVDGIPSDLVCFVTHFDHGSIQSLVAPLPSKAFIKQKYIEWKECMGGKTYQTIPFKQMWKHLCLAHEKAIAVMRWIEQREKEKKEDKSTKATETETAPMASTATAEATDTVATTATTTSTSTPTTATTLNNTRPSTSCYDLDVIYHRDMIPTAYRCVVCDKVANQAVTCKHGKIMGHACYKMGTAGCDCTTNQLVVLSSLRDSIGEVVARCYHHPPPTSTETTIHLTLATTESAAADAIAIAIAGTSTPPTAASTPTITSALALGCQWTGKLENLDTHLAECVWVPVACLHERCESHQIGQGPIIRRGDLSSHMASCQYRKSPCPDCSVAMVYADIPQHQSTTCPDHVIECTNEGCLDNMPRKDLQSHIDTCAHTLVLCSLGCGRSIPRGEISAHESDVGALSSHLHVLRDFIPSHTTSTMVPIRASVDALILRVVTLEQQQSQHMSRIDQLQSQLEQEKSQHMTSIDELKNRISQFQTTYDENENELKQQKESTRTMIKLTNVLQQRLDASQKATDVKLETITTELNEMKRMMAKAKETSTRAIASNVAPYSPFSTYRGTIY